MHVDPRNWKLKKHRALEGLQQAIVRGEVDADLLNILKLINASDNYFTTSSCAGRIMVLEKPLSENKPETHVLGKWHRQVSLEEIREAISKHSKNYLWFKLDGFIFHVVARTLDDAIFLLHFAKNLGLRDSGIRSVSQNGAVVAIVSSERISHLLGVNGKVLISDAELEELVKLANEKFARMRNKLKQLEKALAKILQT
jgi:tRNA wybutosine-synthesizing protein 3